MSHLSGTTPDVSSTESDSESHVSLRAPRHSKSHNNKSIPSQIGFYDSDWQEILVAAKSLYRYHIHTVDPFPERNDNNLIFVQECLLETYQKFMMENEGAEIDIS
jgi:hypothetical protein